MGRKRAIRYGLLAVLAIAGILLGCAACPTALELLLDLRERALLWDLERRQPANLSFSYRACPEAGPAYGDRVVAVEWLEDGVLYCAVVASVNCADEYAQGDYQIEDGDRLVLLYRTVSLWGEAACLCPMQMEYRIEGLERRDYSVSVRRAPLRRPSPLPGER